MFFRISMCRSWRVKRTDSCWPLVSLQCQYLSPRVNIFLTLYYSSPLSKHLQRDFLLFRYLARFWWDSPRVHCWLAGVNIGWQITSSTFEQAIQVSKHLWNLLSQDHKDKHLHTFLVYKLFWLHLNCRVNSVLACTQTYVNQKSRVNYNKPVCASMKNQDQICNVEINRRQLFW